MAKTKKKILFVYSEIGKESLAIEYLSSALKQRGHSTDLIIEYDGEQDFNNRLSNKIKEFTPDFVGFSVVSDNFLWACGVAQYIKMVSKAKIIFGGIHVTSCPVEVINNEFVDYAVLGEGDDVIVDIVENPERENIKNVWFKRRGKIIKNPLRELLQDLDKLPFPDKELFYKEAPHLDKKYYCIIGKGCPFSCTFCFNNYMKKIYCGQRWVRKRTVDNVIEELKLMKDKIGYKRVYFADDCLADNRDWLREFVKKYKQQINVSFTGQSHPQFLDEETCSLLKEAGCIKMQIGAQTPIEKKRREVCKRYDKNETIKKAVDNLKRQKIIVQVDHIFKLPTESVEEYQNGGLDFYIDLKPDGFVCFVLQYYPNVEITKLGIESGEIDDDVMKEVIRGNVVATTSLKKEENKKLLKIFKFIHWIPILPRAFSRFVVRKQLYFLFFNEKIPFVFQYFTNPALLKGLLLSLYRRKTLRNLRRQLSSSL